MARLTQEGNVLWRQPISDRATKWRVGRILLQPGENRIRVESDESNDEANVGDDRRLAVCLLRFSIKGRAVSPGVE